MEEDFATVSELQGRLDFELSDAEVGVAAGALFDLSLDARAHGMQSWTPQTAPRMVKSLVLRAAARFMRNYEGYEQSRAGDETLVFKDTEADPGTAEFNSREIAQLRSLRGSVGLATAPVAAWGSSTRPRRWTGDLFVPNGGDLQPWVAEEDVPFYEGAALW